MTPLVFGLMMGAVPFPPTDPAPSLFRSRKASRNLECERLTVERARELRPGELPPAKPRGEFLERDVVVCAERLLRPGLRDPKDDAILATLEDRVSEVATAAIAARPELETRTWLVETYYPNAPVVTKVSFATKNALMQQGLSVSDRVPTLGAGDIQVLTRMRPEEAYPAACQRYLSKGDLKENDALLAVVSRDPRETILHAGLCVDGNWTWIR